MKNVHLQLVKIVMKFQQSFVMKANIKMMKELKKKGMGELFVMKKKQLNITMKIQIAPK